MIELKASKGLGDALHLRAVVLHLLLRGEVPVVYSSWPDVFADLPIAWRPLDAITDDEALRFCAYSIRLQVPRGMSQFAVCCVQAGIDEPVPLRLGWTVRNTALVERIKCAANDRPVLIYQPPKRAHNDEQREIQPGPDAFARFVEGKADHFRVRVGHPRYVEDGFESACELDLCGQISVTDALDVGTVGDLFFSEPSFLTILAEALERRHVCMFTRRAAQSRFRVSRNVTPERVFHKPELGTAVYDES